MSARGDLLFQGCHSIFPEEEVVVEADGVGGATVIVVEGNYPIDYLIKHQRTFGSEEAACETADQMLEGSAR